MDQPITDKYLSIPFKKDGRDFDGVYCYGLCQLFFKTEKKILLPDNPLPKYLKKMCERIEHPEKHCIVTFKELKGEVQTHIGIMLDDVRFLHISDNLKRNTPFPVIEKITSGSPPWKWRVYGFFRIKKDVEPDRI